MASEERTAPAPASERLRTADRPASLVPMIAIAVIASLVGIALGLIIDWFPLQASTQAEPIDTFYDVLIIASVPMFVLVSAVVLYCAWRFKVRPGEEDMDGPPIHGNTRLEVIWTLIPAVMMLALCTYAFVVLQDAEKAPAAGEPRELNVKVVGEQFTWTFFYPAATPGGEEIASDELYVPKDRSVLFTIKTKDVLHDFWVPEFRWKVDAVPGVDTKYRVTPTRLGTYPVVCAELCGLGHAVMRQSAHVVESAEFDRWLQEKRTEAAGGGEGGEDEGGQQADVDGKSVFTDNDCGSCHMLADAGTDGAIGPNLDETLAGRDANYIRESIVAPNEQITKGFQAGIMPPNYEQTLSAAELDALVTYLEEVAKG